MDTDRPVHPLDEALRLAPAGADRWSGATTPDYANMVGPFGGITNAVLLAAVMRHPSRIGVPVALTVNFAAPIADGAFEVRATPVRTNRSTQHWTLELTQGGEVRTTGSAVCAERRAGWSAPEATMPADVPGPAALPRVSVEQLPDWCRRYDLRAVDGGLERFDGVGGPDSRTRLWLRDDPPRPLDFESLAAICDGFFPRVYLRLGRRVPAGTVSMSTWFHADAALLAAQGERHVLGVARGLNFRDGWFDQSAEIWGATGELLASSHQMVYFRA